MTEQMAIDIVRKEKAYMDSHAGKAQSEAFEMAIKALEEIQQYRVLGLTPTQIYEKIGGLDVELGKYHSLGTVEELRVARDKQIEFCKWEDTEILREKGIQYSSDGLFKPSCNDNEDDFRDWGWIRHFRFCPYCGKRIEVVD